MGRSPNMRRNKTSSPASSSRQTRSASNAPKFAPNAPAPADPASSRPATRSHPEPRPSMILVRRSSNSPLGSAINIGRRSATRKNSARIPSESEEDEPASPEVTKILVKRRSPKAVLNVEPSQNPLRAIGFHDNSKAIEQACANGGENLLGLASEEFHETQFELEDVLKRIVRRKALMKSELKAVDRSSSMMQYLQKANLGEKFSEPMGKPREDKKVVLPGHGISGHAPPEPDERTMNTDESVHEEVLSSPILKSQKGKKNRGNSKKARRPAESQKTLEMNDKHEVPEKFWKSVEPYAGRITRENIDFLDQIVRANEYSSLLWKFKAMMDRYKELRRSGYCVPDDSDGLDDPPLTELELELIERMNITPEAYKHVRRVTQSSTTGHLSMQSSNKMNGGSSIGIHAKGSHKLPLNGDLDPNSNVAVMTNGDALAGENLEPDEDDAAADEEEEEEEEEERRLKAEKFGMIQNVNRRMLDYAKKQTAIQVEKQTIFERLGELDELLKKAAEKDDKKAQDNLRQERRELTKRLRKNREETMRAPIVPSLSGD